MDFFYSLRFWVTYRSQRVAWRVRAAGQTVVDFFVYTARGWRRTHYRDLLTAYFVDQVKNHGLVDFRVTHHTQFPGNAERSAKAILETVTGQRRTVDLNDVTF